VAGLERADGDGFVRSLALPGGPAIVGLYPADGAIRAELQLTQLADLTTAVARCRRLLDLDADPAAVVEVLGSDPVIGRLVHANPGRRSPASVDGAEQAVRAVLGQQVSVAAARTVTAKLVATYGSPLPSELVRSAPGSPTHSFPPMDVLAGADRRQAAEALLRLPGVGPWTAAYVSMRALGDPDVFLATDLGVRHALEQLGAATHPAAVSERARAWAPWRSYALHHLWASLDPQEHTR
jgi:AraC family transcriptional regulator of adaptative response / DNA-3-methyladenine glycosylase II